MTWIDIEIPLIRSIIGDLDSTSYSDGRLTTIAITNAHMLTNEVSFDNSYVVNVPNSSITPDPANGPDYNFLNLLALKTASLIVNSEFRTASMQSFIVKDGPSQIDTGNKAKYLAEFAKNLLTAYQKAKLDYIAGNSIGGTAVSTPIYSNSQFPSMFGTPNSQVQSNNYSTNYGNGNYY